MEKEYIYKIRSFSSCILAAYKLVSENAKAIFRCTWLPMLLYGISSGLYLTLNLRSSGITTFAEEHSYLYIILWTLSFLGMMASYVWASARLLSMLNGESRRWNVIRILLLGLCNLLVFVLFSAVVAGILYLWYRQTGGTLPEMLKDNWLIIGILCLVVTLLDLPFLYINTRYLFDREARFMPDLPKSYATGLRHLGLLFITALLLGLLLGMIFLITSLPFIVLVFANTMSTLGVLMGDPSGLPASFPLLHGGTFCLTAIIWGYLSLFTIIVWLFIYGSIEKQREERKTLIPTTHDTTFTDFEE